MNTTATTFGERMRQRRTELRLTRGQLAERLGWSMHAVMHVESNKYSPSLAAASKIASELGCSLGWLNGEKAEVSAFQTEKPPVAPGAAPFHSSARTDTTLSTPPDGNQILTVRTTRLVILADGTTKFEGRTARTAVQHKGGK